MMDESEARERASKARSECAEVVRKATARMRRKISEIAKTCPHQWVQVEGAVNGYCKCDICGRYRWPDGRPHHA